MKILRFIIFWLLIFSLPAAIVSRAQIGARYGGAVKPATAASANVEFLNSGGSASASFSYDSGTTGSNRALVALITVQGSNDPAPSVSSVTYAGSSLTAITSSCREYDGTSAVCVFAYRRLAPATGSNTLAVTVGTGTFKSVGVMVATGVNQTTPTGGAVTGNGNSSSATVSPTGAATGELLVSAIGMDSRGATVSTGTQIYAATTATSAYASSGSMGYSITGGTDNYATLGFVLKKV